jgi:phenylalanyl-tRNA synthetase beta chain
LGQLVSITGLEYKPTSEAPGPLIPHSVELILDGQHLGWLGGVSAEVAKAFDLVDRALIADIAIELLLQRPQPKQFQPLPLYPSIEEDISLIMDEQMEIGKAIAVISQSSDYIENLELVNIYRHHSLGQGKKSPLLHLTFRAADHTLVSAELADIRTTIVSQLEKIGILVRT